MGISGMNTILQKIQKTFGLDLALVLLLATLLLIFALALPDGHALRIVFGLPFLLFLPGYSLVSALWVKQSELEPLERVGFSLGLSLALVPLVGLGLNYTSWGITLVSVVLSLYFLIIVLVGITWVRRSQLNMDERFSLKQDFILSRMDSMTAADKIMVLLAIIVVIIGAGIMVYITMNPPSESYTELYILDENRTTENYPSILRVNQSSSIIITVVSHEGQDTEYDLVVLLESDTDNITVAQYEFSLDNGAQWERFFNFNVSESGTYRLNIQLYKENDTSPYATNHLWLEIRN